ncbi:MAG: tyrosine--tRNA ligase [Archangium gephyra]|uniref:Tyrosine--tRNA ligase n=1 Tax=Archangium gephyra TaxID=48 RepID=A0A2W5T585_9BACT|nr:MAG: tyrosine--tRNA ligase [Archangium gephyra]
MKTDFIQELTWRRMLHDSMPGTDKLLNSERVSGYIGFDPTADSLGVGNLVQVMTLLHFQQAGHKPFALMGGATGMIGDPSLKSEERSLLSTDTLQANLAGQKKQLERFLDFSGDGAELVNNYDWFKDIGFLDFIRDAGKHLTVNYMMAKDSVKNRLTGENRDGMSFTEFTYQLIQGWDFYWLYKHRGVKLQMGGSDQWGNITTGTELIRRKAQGEAYALTTPLIKKADGVKFGKTEKGNVWLDAKRTSPYEFFQFWLNASDEDVKNYIRVFTLLDRATIEGLETEHDAAPQNRLLQKTLAKDITTRVHGKDEVDAALAATELLFGKGTVEQLKSLSAEVFERVFVGAGVPVADVPRDQLSAGVNVIDLFTEKSQLVASKGEARKLMTANALSVNKAKVSDPKQNIGTESLINERYVLLQKGKKDYCLIRAV